MLEDKINNTTVIVAAAGASKRMGRPKLFINIKGRPVLAWTLQALARSPDIDSIVVVTGAKYIKKVKEVIKKYRIRKVRDVVTGGRHRSDSVFSGLKRLEHSDRYVLVHDGARPFVDNKIIKRVLTATAKYGAAITGVVPKSTIKRVKERGFVHATLDRRQLVEVQTPQAFKKELLLEAYSRGRAGLCGLAFDDASLVESLGRRVKVVEGAYRNIKITTPEDIAIANALIK